MVSAQQPSLTLRSAATNSFISFLGSVAGVHLEKQRARNEAVSALTDGVLCSSVAMHASLTASSVVYNTQQCQQHYRQQLHYN